MTHIPTYRHIRLNYQSGHIQYPKRYGQSSLDLSHSQSCEKSGNIQSQGKIINTIGKISVRNIAEIK